MHQTSCLDSLSSSWMWCRRFPNRPRQSTVRLPCRHQNPVDLPSSTTSGLGIKGVCSIYTYYCTNLIDRLQILFQQRPFLTVICSYIIREKLEQRYSFSSRTLGTYLFSAVLPSHRRVVSSLLSPPAHTCAKAAKYLQYILAELNALRECLMPLYAVSEAAIAITTTRASHIEIQHFTIQE